MLGKSENEEGSDRDCHGIAIGSRPCNQPATVHCNTCDLWFCDLHAEDEQWHACMSKQRAGSRND